LIGRDLMEGEDENNIKNPWVDEVALKKKEEEER
jgi:hypothetical protein